MEPQSRLRWRICKLFKVLPDDPLFDKLNAVQWKWIRDNVMKDDEELVDLSLDVAEYMAQFWNADAVRQARHERMARKRTPEDVESRDIFEKQVEEWFGSSIDLSQTVPRTSVASSR